MLNNILRTHWAAADDMWLCVAVSLCVMQVLQSAFYPTNTYDAVEADVWALGIVLCHMFFGAHTPFWCVQQAGPWASASASAAQHAAPPHVERGRQPHTLLHS